MLLVLFGRIELLLATRQNGHLRIENAENNTKSMHFAMELILCFTLDVREDGVIARLTAGHLH